MKIWGRILLVILKVICFIGWVLIGISSIALIILFATIISGFKNIEQNHFQYIISNMFSSFMFGGMGFLILQISNKRNLNLFRIQFLTLIQKYVYLAPFLKKGVTKVKDYELYAYTAVSDEDLLLRSALECVIEAGCVSIPMLQRRLKIGYARAVHLVDEMEAMGYVGAQIPDMFWLAKKY